MEKGTTTSLFNFVIILILLVIVLITAVKGSCTIQECPQGSEIKTDCKCECKAGYHREDIKDYESRCYKVDCPAESKKILNETNPSIIPTCKCDVDRNYWGLDPKNCNIKLEGCPNGELVRETGNCGCDPELEYVAGECLPEHSQKHSGPSKYKQSFEVAIIAGCIGGSLLVAIFGLLFWYWRRRQNMKKNENSAIEQGETHPLRTNQESSQDEEAGRTEERDCNDQTVEERNLDENDLRNQDLDPSPAQNESERSNGEVIFNGLVIYNCSDVQNGANNSKSESN